MKCIGRMLLVILLLGSAVLALAEEKGRRFEVSLSGGISYATSSFGFSPELGFSFYPVENLALSFGFGVAYHLPELDFRQFADLVGDATQDEIIVRVRSQYRLFSTLSAEYSFDLSPRIKPFASAGIGWCGDYVDINVYNWTSSNLANSKDVRYRKNGSFFLFGGGIGCPLGENGVLKLMLRVLNPGGDFSTYQVIARLGFRF